MTITLPTQPDLEIIFGSSNIASWSEADNDHDNTKRKARITWAIAEAYRYITGRLAGRYPVENWLSIPAEVFALTARRAGIELYQSPRGLVDGDDAGRMLMAHSTAIEARLEQILSGQFKLFDLDSQPVNVPVNENSTAPFKYCERRNTGQIYGEPVVGDYDLWYPEVQ